MFPLIILLTWVHILSLLLLSQPSLVLSLPALSFPSISFIQFCLLRAQPIIIQGLSYIWTTIYSAWYTTVIPTSQMRKLGWKEGRHLDQNTRDNKCEKGVMMRISDFHLSLFQFLHTAFKTAWSLAHFHLTDARVKKDACGYAPDNTRHFNTRT